MDARRESLPDPAGLRALLSPSVIVSLALALTAAVLALVYLLQMRAPAARGAAAAHTAPGRADAPAGAAAALPASVPEPVEFRCVDGLRVRKQGSSYTGDGRC